MRIATTISTSTESITKDATTPTVQQPDFGKLKVDVQDYVSTFSLLDFLDPTKPWILVKDGSFMGFFEFVPPVFRQGPWAAFPMAFISGAIYYTLLSFVYHYSAHGLQDIPNHYYEALTTPWYLNVAGFLWTTYVFRDLFVSGLGAIGMTTWTVQSYFYMWLRFLLSTVAPLYPQAAIGSELLRYPMLSQATVTFVVWNIVLAPTIFLHIKDPQKRQGFVKYFTNFRLTQLHFFNIFFATFSGVWGAPRRPFFWTDLHAAMGLGLQYFFFYVMILDRLGIHFYLIFSPRTNVCILFLSLVIIATFGMYPFWNQMIDVYGGYWE